MKFKCESLNKDKFITVNTQRWIPLNYPRSMQTVLLQCISEAFIVLDYWRSHQNFRDCCLLLFIQRRDKFLKILGCVCILLVVWVWLHAEAGFPQTPSEMSKYRSDVLWQSIYFQELRWKFSLSPSSWYLVISATILEFPFSGCLQQGWPGCLKVLVNWNH